MKTVDFNSPAFTTVAWVSDQSKNVWEPRLKQVNDAIIHTILKTVENGIHSVMKFQVQKTHETRIQLLSANYNLIVKTIKETKEGKRSSYTSILVSSLEGEESKTDSLSKQSNCCHAITTETFVRNRKEQIWETAFTGSYDILGEETIQLPHTSQKGDLWRKLIVYPFTGQFCSFFCENRDDLEKEFMAQMRLAGYEEEFQWLQELYSWPIEWSANHGICELRTPILKCCYETDWTSKEYRVQITGEDYPDEGMEGLRFPYQKRSFLRITDSKSFKKNLEHAAKSN